jgi:hypothetical protein
VHEVKISTIVPGLFVLPKFYYGHWYVLRQVAFVILSCHGADSLSAALYDNLHSGTGSRTLEGAKATDVAGDYVMQLIC